MGDFQRARIVFGRQENAFEDRPPKWMIENYMGRYIRSHPEEFCRARYEFYSSARVSHEFLAYGPFEEDGHYWPVRVHVDMELKCWNRATKSKTEWGKIDKVFDWKFYRKVDDAGSVSWVER